MNLPKRVSVWEPGRGYVSFWPALEPGNRLALHTDQDHIPETMVRAVATFREVVIGSVVERMENKPGVKP